MVGWLSLRGLDGRMALLEIGMNGRVALLERELNGRMALFERLLNGRVALFERAECTVSLLERGLNVRCPSLREG